MIHANTLQVIMSVARSQINNNRSIKEAQLMVETQRLKAMAETARIQSQKEIIQSMMALSQHAYDRKMDFFVQTYNKFHSLINQHQDELLEELKSLRGKEFEDNITENQFIQIIQARSVINTELSELKKINALMTHEFNQQVAVLSIEFNIPSQEFLPYLK